MPANTNYIFKVIGDIDGEIYTDEITFSTFNTDDYTFSLKSIESIKGLVIKAKILSINKYDRRKDTVKIRKK